MSGERTTECAQAVFRPDKQDSDSDPFDIDRPTVLEGYLRLGTFRSPVPTDLYLWPNRRSYTGQPVAEFHTVGATPILDALVRELCAAGARPAEAGEFTLRAFLCGRIDLTQAEAVLGTIDATNRSQLDTALAQLAGGLSRPLSALRDSLLDVTAHLEAGLDFADEDLPFITPDELQTRLRECADAIDRLTSQLDTRHQATDLPKVVLSGAPNAGKSSLFNALVRGLSAQSCGTLHTDAIVSRVPGTTRDYLTATLVLDDLACQLVDTAGIQSAEDQPIESAAQARMEDQCQTADVVLFCVDSSSEEKIAQATGPNADSRRIIVLTKCDKEGPLPTQAEGTLEASILTSSKTGHGLDALKEAVRRAVLARTGTTEGLVVTTAVRCRDSLRLTGESLHRALARLNEAFLQEELIAADLHIALEEIGKIVGVIYTDDLLDRVFSRFCIGK